MGNNIQNNIEEVEIALGIKKGIKKFTPEWFHEKGQLLLSFDKDAEPYYKSFQNSFNKEALLKLDDTNILTALFLCGNKTNLCYLLEFEPNYYRLFGSIKGGNAFKYPLHVDSKTGDWVTGTQRNPKFLTNTEAISYGKRIRDLLITSLDIIEQNNSLLTTVEGYLELSRKLDESVSELFGSIWFSKYLHLMYPDLFPVFHNREWQDKVLDIIGEETDERAFCRIGKIQIFIKKCNISSVVFSQVIYQYCNETDGEEDIKNLDESEALIPDETKHIKGGENVILYGVPGSGKSYKVKHEYLARLGEEQHDRVVFHPDYTYSDFVGQILPEKGDNGSLTYKFNPGPFTRIMKKAYKSPDKKFVLVIEEINRGNAPAIFGDIFQLLDREKEGDKEGFSEYSITNHEIGRELFDDEDAKIKIPSNLSIIATMNTSDQNVFTLDNAFQRRWKMVQVANVFDKSKKEEKDLAETKVLDTDLIWEDFMKIINEQILNKNMTMTSMEDKRLGTHFVDMNLLKDDRQFSGKVLKYLWDDGFKFARNDVFNSEFKTLEDLTEKFVSNSGQNRLDIFNESVKKAIDDYLEDIKNRESEEDGENS